MNHFEIIQQQVYNLYNHLCRKKKKTKQNEWYWNLYIQ